MLFPKFKMCVSNTLFYIISCNFLLTVWVQIYKLFFKTQNYVEKSLFFELLFYLKGNIFIKGCFKNTFTTASFTISSGGNFSTISSFFRLYVPLVPTQVLLSAQIFCNTKAAAQLSAVR